MFVVFQLALLNLDSSVLPVVSRVHIETRVVVQVWVVHVRSSLQPRAKWGASAHRGFGKNNPRTVNVCAARIRFNK